MEELRRHGEQMLATLRKSGRVEVLEVSFPELVANPGPVIARIAAFLPDRFCPDAEVSACVKPRLHRNRGGAWPG